MASRGQGIFSGRLTAFLLGGLLALGGTQWGTVQDWLDQLGQSRIQPMAVPATAQVEIGFSPLGGAEALVLKAIASAQREIRVAAYSFTSKPIARALLAAKTRGVDIQVVLDKSQQTERYSAATFLHHAGIAVRIDTRHAIQHNKYLVIDGVTTELGSFNYSRAAAEKNAENVLVLWQQPRIAAHYLADWQRLWDAAKAYAPSGAVPQEGKNE